MTGRTHRIGGLCTGILISNLYIGTNLTSNNLKLSLLFTGACVLGSLIPDIDHRGSTISNKNMATKTVSNIISLFGHRGITHTPIIYILLLLLPSIFFSRLENPFELYTYILSMGCIIGAFSHLILDLLTVEGIPLFFPLSIKKVHLLPIKTGQVEYLIQGLIILITICYFIFH